MSDLRFVQISDIHYGHPGREGKPVEWFRGLRGALAAVQRTKPDLVIVTGDLTENAKAEHFRGVVNELNCAGVPWFATPGNHDVGDHPTPELLEQWRSIFGPTVRTVRHGPAALFTFNSMLQGDALQSEIAELRRELIEHADAGARAVFTHRPLFLETPNDPDSYWIVAGEHRFALLDLLAEHKVGAVITGHLHRNLTRHHQGVLHQTSGSVSFQLTDDPLGVRLWTAGPAGFSHNYEAI